MASRKIGKLVSKNTALFLCDMQEKFRPTIKFYPQIINVAGRILGTAQALDMPVIVTEQYPKGLGPTVSELDVSQYKVYPKTCFSMIVPEVASDLEKYGEINSIILCGIEAHACVQQTVFDLVEKNYDVHVVVDACSSRSLVERMYAYQRMREAGAHLTTSESVILGLVKDAGNPAFKKVQKLIMESAPDSGLLGAAGEGSLV